MASNVVNATYVLKGDATDIKKLTESAKGLKVVMQSTVEAAKPLKGNIINFAALATGLNAIQRSFSQLQACLKDLADAYAVQEIAETQLATVMRERMGATADEIQSIKDLARAQQELGVIGDEIQLSGAQQIATFVTQKESLEALIPAMNNLLAQQHGLNSTTQDAVNVGNLMGKVMQGQTAALTRVGITFSEAEAKVLKYGTESERAAMLAQVITNNVGDMNAQLAKTDSGKQQQLLNTLGDIKEQIGGVVKGALPFVTITAQTTTAITGVTTLIAGMKTLTLTVYRSAKAFAVSTAALIKNKIATIALSTALRLGASSVRALSLALRGLAAATVVTAVIAGISYALSYFTEEADNAAEVSKELAEELKQFKEEAKDIGRATGDNAQKEIANLTRLVNVVREESESKAERLKALKELQSIYPAYFNSISLENSGIKRLTAQYDQLRNAIIQTARAKAAENKIVENTGTLIDVELQIANKEKEIETLQKAYEIAQKDYKRIKDSVVSQQEKLNPLVSALSGQAISQGEEKIYSAAKSVSKYKGELSDANVELKALIQKQEALNSANIELSNIVKGVKAPAPLESPNAHGKENKITAVNPNATTLKAITDNIHFLQGELQKASLKEAALINQEIAGWKKKAEAIENAGKVVEDKANQPLNEQAAILSEISNNVDILTARLQKSTVEEAQLINKQIESWNKKAEAIRQAGIAAENVEAINRPLKANAATLKDINLNIETLTAKLQEATISEAAMINQQIKAWNDKAEAIKNAGKIAEKTATSTGNSLQAAWGGIRNISGGIESITDRLRDNGGAWQVVVNLVDGFIGLYEGVKAVIGVIDLLTTASAAHATVKGIEATAETTEAVTRSTAATTGSAASLAIITANKLEAASFKELAAAQYMAAHASIPFAGFGIGAGFTSAMLATVTAAGIPMLAEGGIATGPTLAMVGEYAGARSNPEIIAPLDKLRDMLTVQGGQGVGRVEFEIQGRKLVGILEKESTHKRRG